MRKDGLTRKNIAFCDRFIAGGLCHASRAYMEAYPKASQRTAQNNASTLLADPRVKVYIETAVASLPACKTVNVEFVISGLKKLALEASREADRIRAYELLGKYLQIFRESEVNTAILTLEDYAHIRTSLNRVKDVTIPDTSISEVPIANGSSVSQDH